MEYQIHQFWVFEAMIFPRNSVALSQGLHDMFLTSASIPVLIECISYFARQIRTSLFCDFFML